MYKLINGKKIKALWDNKNKKWWVSAADAVVALRNCDYDTARNYWKQYKYRLQKSGKNYISFQLKMPAKDNKMRYMDVIDFKALAGLMQKIQLPGSIKNWIEDKFLSGKNTIEEMEKCLENVSHTYDKTKKYYMSLTKTREIFVN